MVQWADGVNKQIKRGSDWEVPTGVILEKTRCGKPKARPSNQLQGKIFNIQMQFTYEEYLIFDAWFETTLRNGALTFAFPDVITNLVEREYRIVGSYKVDNPSGKIIKVSMEWQEVR